MLKLLKIGSVLLFGAALAAFFPFLSETGVTTNNQRFLCGAIFTVSCVLSAATAFRTTRSSEDEMPYTAMSIASLLGAFSIFAPEIGTILFLLFG